METSYVIEIFINYNSNPGLMTMPHYFIDNLFSIESNSTFYSSTVYVPHTKHVPDQRLVTL